jgi:predicted O-linked N-acetylglucosamine transferase (SPINDLY family)
MGARFIDCVIGDPVVAPLSEAANFTEKIAQLPDCYLVTDTTRAIPAGSPDRRAAGLPDDGFVFLLLQQQLQDHRPGVRALDAAARAD